MLISKYIILKYNILLNKKLIVLNQNSITNQPQQYKNKNNNILIFI